MYERRNYIVKSAMQCKIVRTTADHRPLPRCFVQTRCLWIKIIVMLLSSSLVLTSSAQQLPTLSKKSSAIKRKADTLTAHAPISVVLVNGTEEYGEFVSNDEVGITFYDVDRKMDVTLKYADLRKLKNEYGGYNSLQKKHTDRARTVVVVVIILAALGALIGAATASKN